MNIKTLLFAIIIFFGCTPKNATTNNQNSRTTPTSSISKVMKTKPKNIILLVGDGMGLTQITAGMYMNGNKLNLEKFPITGLHKSYAYDNLVTDSAAGATAFACGVKTYNGAIGVDHDTIPIKTILEEAEENGLATGMVATSTIVHATPGSFIAHQKQRRMYEEIAADFLKTDIDIFIGGGKKFFNNRESDDRDLYAELRAKGYVMSDFFEKDLEDIQIDKTKKFGYLTANKDPLPVAQGRDYLMPATLKTLDFLDNRSDKGFFLMIEGSQIDWGGHANNSDYIVTEMIEFDNVIGEVLKYAKEDGETLVIVTADHETGGYAINKGSTRDSLVTAFTTDYHTAVMIPVFAYGPGSEAFSGIYENTAIYDKMKSAFGF